MLSLTNAQIRDLKALVQRLKTTDNAGLGRQGYETGKPELRFEAN